MIPCARKVRRLNPLSSSADPVAGVQFLSLIIERCPKDKLNRQAGTSFMITPAFAASNSHTPVHVLATFYCSKLEDTETITPALKGLSHLVKSPSLASSDVPDVINAYVVCSISSRVYHGLFQPVYPRQDASARPVHSFLRFQHNRNFDKILSDRFKSHGRSVCGRVCLVSIGGKGSKESYGCLRHCTRGAHRT